MKYTVFMPWIIAYNIGLLCGLWIGPLQLAIHLIQNRQAGERKSQNGQDKQKIYIIWNGIFFVYLVPVPLLLSSTTDLYHVNDWLQRAYYCWQWLLKWYVVIELLDVAYSFVSFFFFIFFQVMFVERNFITYLYWTRDVVTEQFPFIKLIKKLNF